MFTEASSRQPECMMLPAEIRLNSKRVVYWPVLARRKAETPPDL
jgi:hypothetical protein